MATPPDPSPSPLLGSALELLRDRGSARQLADRFRAAGAPLAPEIVEDLLAQLAQLGLVRVARPSPSGGVFVPTSLGRRVTAGELELGEGAVNRLAELEQMRTDLLSTIAHELRTPLTAIRTSVGLLLDPGAEPTADQRRTLLETVERNAERMQRVVGDILDLARFRSGGISLQLRRFDAGELATAAVASIAPLVALQEQRLETALPTTGRTMVYGDRRRLEQALVNLLSNAQRFTPAHGRIDVRVTAANGLARWSVRDEGPGIPLEERARLFERFFVGRADRAGAGTGVGLGLPTALAIAQAHGGTIEVVSEPGAGSTFTLVVPVAGPPEAE